MLLNLSIRKLNFKNCNRLVTPNSSPIANFSISSTRSYSSVPVLSKNLLIIGKQSSSSSLSKNARKMSTTSPVSKIVKTFENFTTSDQDSRKYRGLLLENGLKCLVVSDPKTDRSAASVDVHAGYMLDPRDRPGLAHFCEHMLFMGSKKYPGENVFSKFIEDHSGSTNAYTANENTNYHFEVSTSHFKEALDIFAQFFIAPTFDPSSVDRELKAVDSENQKNLQSDAWRINQLESTTCRADHSFSKFGTGNLETLKTDPEKKGLAPVREELLKFHSDYYSSNLMTLCMVGKEPLDELAAYASEMFSEIPNKNLKPTDFGPDPFGSESVQTIKYVTPVQDLRYLALNWVIPDHRADYDVNPSQYMSHLVGHEGPGSLLVELKKRGWCNNLHAGSRREARGFEIFNLTVDLSEEGGEKINEIITLCYQYLNMVRSQKPVKWIFDELNDLGKIGFSYKDKEKPDNFASAVTADMHVFEFDDLLTANYYMTRFGSDMIESLNDYMTPDKMRVTVVSKKYEGKTDTKEQWYGTEYKSEKIDPAFLAELNKCGLNEKFHLPEKNDFIPQDLKLVEHKKQEVSAEHNNFPRVIKSNELSRLWFKEDTKFLLPKASLKFELRNPLAYADPVHVNMCNMFVELFLDSLTEDLYAAELAGLKYNIRHTNYGLSVSCSGFNDKLGVLVATLFERMANFKCDPARFAILKESYQRQLVNFEAEQPYQHSVYYTTVLISEKAWTKSDLLRTVNDFDVNDVQALIPRLLTQGLHIESLMFGNLTQERAIDLLSLVEQALESSSASGKATLRPLAKAQMKNFRQVQLPENSDKVFIKKNSVHKTAGIEVYYQCGTQSDRANALVELFCQVINESAFNILRTKEQLGYIVASGMRNFGGAQGVRLVIQSDRTPVYLDERIENFLRLTAESVDSISDEEFKTHVDALIETKLEEPKKLNKQADIYWNEISSHQYHFNREKVEVEEVRKLTKDDLKQFFKKLICEKSKERRKLACYIYTDEMEEKMTRDENIKGKLIEDISDWHSGLHLFPLAKPCIDLNCSAKQ